MTTEERCDRLVELADAIGDRRVIAGDFGMVNRLLNEDVAALGDAVRELAELCRAQHRALQALGSHPALI